MRWNEIIYEKRASYPSLDEVKVAMQELGCKVTSAPRIDRDIPTDRHVTINVPHTVAWTKVERNKLWVQIKKRLGKAVDPISFDAEINSYTDNDSNPIDGWMNFYVTCSS